MAHGLGIPLALLLGGKNEVLHCESSRREQMRDRKGFTLIELLIVVVIIGILAAIAIPKFSATREKAYYAAMKSDLKNLASQQEIYYSDYYIYTATVADLGYVFSDKVTVLVSKVTATGWYASATHLALPATGIGCELTYGDAAPGTYKASGTPGPQAGVINCITQ
jgi:type IV pilus assembly protein PilA